MAMTRRKIMFETARDIGRALPDVEEGTAYGSRALKVRGRMLAVVPTHRSAEPNSLIIHLGFEQRDELLAADPDTYYLKDHYRNYPVILVRLSRVSHDALRDLLLMAWREVSAGGKRSVQRRRRSTRRGA
jgi:hypothetical protein